MKERKDEVKRKKGVKGGKGYEAGKKKKWKDTH